MSSFLAALLLPIPILHLWLHALLSWWRRQPPVFYLLSLLLWIGAFWIVPAIAVFSPLAFSPNDTWRAVGFILMALGALLVISSLFTLGFRRFFLWAVLHPESEQSSVIESKFYKLIPHPAYLGYILVALGNLFSSGKLYLAGVLLWLLILTPIVIKLEEEELKNRSA